MHTPFLVSLCWEEARLDLHQSLRNKRLEAQLQLAVAFVSAVGGLIWPHCYQVHL